MFVRNTPLAIRKRILKDSRVFLSTRFFIIATRLNSNRSKIAWDVQDLLHLRLVETSNPARIYTHRYSELHTKAFVLHCQQCIGLGNCRILNVPQRNGPIAPRTIFTLATENKEQRRLRINTEKSTYRLHPVLTASFGNLLNQILVSYNIGMKRLAIIQKRQKCT